MCKCKFIYSVCICKHYVYTFITHSKFMWLWFHSVRLARGRDEAQWAAPNAIYSFSALCGRAAARWWQAGMGCCNKLRARCGFNKMFKCFIICFRNEVQTNAMYYTYEYDDALFCLNADYHCKYVLLVCFINLLYI